MDSIMNNPAIQYGFAGFSVILIGIIVWLIKQLLQVIKDANKVIAGNTKMIADNSEAVREQSRLILDTIKLNRKVHDRLLTLRCFAEADSRASGGDS